MTLVEAETPPTEVEMPGGGNPLLVAVLVDSRVKFALEAVVRCVTSTDTLPRNLTLCVIPVSRDTVRIFMTTRDKEMMLHHTEGIKCIGHQAARYIEGFIDARTSNVD